MTFRRLLHRLSTRLLPLVIAGCAAVPAFAQTDPPVRVARINHAEGAVTFSTTGDNEWTDAEANRPLTRGDRLWTDKGARAEIQVGSSAVRMDGHTQLEILTLDDQSTQLSVTQGTVYVRVRSLPEGENFEVDTPNLAYRAAYPGDYRIDVDAIRGVTRVTIHSGTGAVYGEAGESLPLGGGQQITFKARNLAQLAVQESPPQDNFDRWAADRNRREDQSVSARYVPREVVGYQQLDAAGQWSQDATYGPVWIPQGTPSNWAPYRHGRWEWIGPWGWTWIDDAAWGFATSHYGRWAMVGSRWAWVPGRMGLRPVYAPALVAFIGGSSGGVSWTATIAGGKPGIAWFPLAPGEAWQPGYRASPVYMSNLNRNLAGSATTTYAHQRRADALTAISAEDFQRGKPARGSWLRVAGNILGTAQVVPPPPMPTGVRERTAVARAASPASPDTAKPVAPEQPQRVEQAKAAQEAKAAEQTKAAAEAKAAEQAKAQQLQQAQAAEQLKAAAEHARAQQQAAQAKAAAEQARLLQEAKAAAEQAKIAQQAKADEKPGWFQQLRAKFAEFTKPAVDPVKTAQQVQTTQQAQLAEIAKAAEQARRSKQAKAPAEPAVTAEQAQAAEETRAARHAARLAERARAAEESKAAREARAEEHARIAEQARADAHQRRAAAQASKGAVARVVPSPRATPPVRVVEAPKRAEPTKRELMLAKRAEAKREQLAKREFAKKELLAKKEQQQSLRRELAAKRELTKREEVARRAEHAKREALARREDEIRRVAHLEQAKRIADRDAQALREQRTRREELAKREAEAREQAQRDAWQQKQQALAEQWRRDQQAWEQQQQIQRARGVRPDLRKEAPSQPEVWQRGIPILAPGRTS